MSELLQNEQWTENLVRKLMQFEIGQNDGFYVYPQSVDTRLSAIKECLDRAGGKPNECALSDFSSSTKGSAKPEYIITIDNDPSTIIVIECKRAVKQHTSNNLSYPKKYAVDGVLYYAKYLKNNFNVIAIAVSGSKADSYKSSTFYWLKQADTYKVIDKTQDILLTPLNYINIILNKQLVKKFSIEEIKVKANLFNNLMRDYLHIQPQERILFIASCLLALQDDYFKKTYNLSTDNISLLDTLITAVERVLKVNHIPTSKVELIINNTKLLQGYSKLLEMNQLEDGSLLYFLKQLELVIIPMINDSNAHQDALGIFYHEFIKYTAGNAGHELGIVLTPEHLCDFMCEVADINENDTVIDICCGTGSFLVSAMKHMIKKAKNTEQIRNIKHKQLFGLEQQTSIYTIATTNMIIRGDGQSNIYNSDCFKFNKKEIASNNGKEPNWTVGLLNPPYSQKNRSELSYLKRMLDILETRGIGVVVVPMSCAIGTKFKEERKALFENHTLKAVFSMPNDIFYPIGTNVCVMVWEAHRKHNSNMPTFFGYYKDDGFMKKKHLGRIDIKNKWLDIKKEWLDLYRTNKEQIGKTVLQCVTDTDEWLVEAYMETDYSTLTQNDFEQTVREYLAYKIKNGID